MPHISGNHAARNPGGSAAELEAGHQGLRERHGVNLSKAGASRVRKNAPVLLSVRLHAGRERKRWCREWKTIDVLLVPPLENDELPQPQRVIAPPFDVLVDDAADECRREEAA